MKRKEGVKFYVVATLAGSVGVTSIDSSGSSGDGFFLWYDREWSKSYRPQPRSINYAVSRKTPAMSGESRNGCFIS